MTAQQIRRDSRLFFSGLLISSVGSMTFTVGLIVFMARAGYGLFHISLIVGLSRLIPILVSVFLGDLADRLSPKQTVLATEVLAGLSSIGILLSWGEHGASYPILLTLCLVRAVILAVQLGSRAKLVKQLSDSSYESNSRNAILFNKATQGATLFAGILAWIAFKYVSFPAVVILDAATFLLNGLFLLGLSQPEGIRAGPSASAPILKKFRDLYAFNPKTAMLDALLALAIMGMASFNTRLAGDHQEWNAVLVISYGLAVWVAGWIERSGWLRRYEASCTDAWAPSRPARSLSGLVSPRTFSFGFCFIGSRRAFRRIRLTRSSVRFPTLETPRW